MKTKYRKIEVSVRKPNDGWVLTPSGGWLFINGKFKCPHSGEIQNDNDIKYWLEEIEDNSQIKTQEEIIQKVKELEKEKQEWILKQNGFKWTESERQNGSFVYGHYQDKESECSKQIRLLNWVLNEN